MIWMVLLHAVPMGLLLFWSKIPAGYTWIAYGAIGVFVLAHFAPLFAGKGHGGCDHAKDIPGNNHTTHEKNI